MKRNCLLYAAVLFWLVACAPKPPDKTPTQAGPHEQLLPPSALPYDFMWRQLVTAQWPSGKQSFEAVLQKRGSELTLLGLSPMGLPGFVITLREDGSIEVHNRMGRPLPFEPAYVLADVQRVYFPWLSQVAANFEGEREGEHAGLRVRERYHAGQLVTREFRRKAGEDAVVRVTYSGFPPHGDAPREVALDNQWHRYRLLIETFEQQRL
jgi:hypothetical protein